MQYVSQILSQASGSVAGSTFSHNQHVKYIRARTTPTDPKTPLQRQVRRRFRILSIYWQTWLNDAQRSAWQTYAANVTLPNALGVPSHLSARSHFIRANMALTFVDPAPLYHFDAPETYALAQHTAPSWTATAALQRVSVTYTFADKWLHEWQGFLVLYVSKPQTSSINFWAGPYRYLGVVPGHPEFPEAPPKAFDALDTITEGQRLFFRCRASRQDGRLSEFTRGCCDVQA